MQYLKGLQPYNACKYYTRVEETDRGQTYADRMKPWAEFSTLEEAACHSMHLLHSMAIWPNLELKTQPKQLLGYLPLDIALIGLAVINALA